MTVTPRRRSFTPRPATGRSWNCDCMRMTRGNWTGRSSCMRRGRERRGSEVRGQNHGACRRGGSRRQRMIVENHMRILMVMALCLVMDAVIGTAGADELGQVAPYVSETAIAVLRVDVAQVDAPRVVALIT